jgi:hypothetical protein
MTIDIAELFARGEHERDAPPRQNPPEPNFSLIPSGPVQMQICSHISSLQVHDREKPRLAPAR